MSLIWGAGVSAPSGVATTERQALAFKTREVFRARFACERVNKDAQCIPVLPMSLSFTAPLARADAQQIVLRARDGQSYQAHGRRDQRAPFGTDVSFKGPFPEKTEFTIELPPDLKDAAGRSLASGFPLAVATDEDHPSPSSPPVSASSS